MVKKQIIATSLGNILEWLDFGIFIFFSSILGGLFFPSHNSFINTLVVLSVFAAGFICRPLGGILFGHLGDRYGRANTLRLSILFITLSTLFIGCLPTYQTIGISATFLFLFLRLIQGLSIGGEYSGVMIYLAESAAMEQRGLITSFAAISANFGFLLATFILILLNQLLSQSLLIAWGWRIPFLLIGLFGSIIIYLRFHLPETPTFTHLKNTYHLSQRPFLASLQHAPKQLLKIIGLTCMGASFYYVFIGFMPTFMSNFLGTKNNIALLIQSISLILMLLLTPLAGYCGDQIGRKNMLILTATSIIFLSIPLFILLHQNILPLIFMVFLVATVLSSLEQGNTLSAIVENCPANIRYSGIAFSYNLGNAIFGGTAPLIFTLLTRKISFIAPAFYLMLMAFLTLIAAFTLLDKKDINQYFS